MNTIGIASTATGLVGRNSRLGKKSLHRRRLWARRHVSRNLQRDSGGFVYNGRRRSLIGEKITTYPGGVATVSENRRFVYDGNQIVLQLDRTDGNAMAASDLSHRYLWGPAVDQLMADEQVSNSDLVVWALTDQENSVRDLATYSSGTTTIVTDQIFSAYGQIVSQRNLTTNPMVTCLFGYTGRPFDAATGLQDNDNRWYDAVTGRWLSQDPIGFFGRDANLYRYCGNSPTNHVDPSGKFLPLVFGAVFVVYVLYTNYANAPAPGNPTYPDNSGQGIPAAVAAGLTAGLGPPAVRYGLSRAGACAASRAAAAKIVAKLAALQAALLKANESRDWWGSQIGHLTGEALEKAEEIIAQREAEIESLQEQIRQLGGG